MVNTDIEAQHYMQMLDLLVCKLTWVDLESSTGSPRLTWNLVLAHLGLLGIWYWLTWQYLNDCQNEFVVDILILAKGRLCYIHMLKICKTVVRTSLSVYAL